MLSAFLLLASLIATASAFGSSKAGARKTALIHVDIQKCFTNGPPVGVDNDYAYCNPPSTGGTDECTRLGSLGVAEGATIVPQINDLRHSCLFDGVFRSQDYHPANHISFGSRHFGENPFSFAGGPLPFVGYPIELSCTKSETENIKDVDCCLVSPMQPACMIGENGTSVCKRDTDPANPACQTCYESPEECTKMMQGMWTDHCEQDGDSGFASGMETSDSDVILQKGVNPDADAYSIFMDNPRLHKTALDSMLKEEGFEVLYIGGIAYDFCVYWTAIDGLALGYEVYVIEDATAAIGVPNGDGTTTIDTAKADMLAKGVKFVTVAEVMGAECPEGKTNTWTYARKSRHLAEKFGKKVTLW